MVVEHLYHKCFGTNILAYLRINHLFLAFAFVDGLLHHTRANGSHLRTMVGVHDGCHDVATESRTNLIEQVLVGCAALGISMVTDFQLGTVGCQTAGQGRRYTRTQVATYHSGTHQGYLWLLLLEQIHQDIGMRNRGVREQAWSIEHKQLVHAVRQNLVFHLAFYFCACHDGMQLNVQLIGELATLGQQLLRYFGYGCAFNLTIYKYIVHSFSRLSSCPTIL